MSVYGSMWRRLAPSLLAVAILTATAFVATTVAASPKPSTGVPGSKLVPALDLTKNGNGVTSKTINIVFNWPLSPCGSDPATAGAYVVAKAQQEDVASVLVRWFNQNVPFPGGRKLVLHYVDDGGGNVGCAAKARSAGLQASKQIKAFASIGNSSNLDGNSVYAQTVTANGTIDIAPAASFQLAKDFTDRWPYAWGVYAPGDQTFQELAWYLGKRVKDTQYTAPGGQKSARKWGMIFFDGDIGHAMAKTAVANLKTIGITPSVYYVPQDHTQQAQQVTSLVAKIKNAGVNSLIYAINDATPDQLIAKAFNSQNLFPDWYVTDYALFVKYAVFASALFPEQIARVSGVGVPNIVAARIDVHPDGSNGASAKLQANDWRTAATAAYVAAGGKNPNPQVGSDLQGDWYSLSMLAMGILNAGKTLNAFTFANGLQSSDSCELQRFFGEYQPQTAIPKFTKAQPWALHGYTSYYWSSAHQSTYGASTAGYFESYDGYFRYTTQKALPAQPFYDTGAHGGQYPLRLQAEGKYSPTMTCPVK
jgi:hypothetical protein